jgi:hypothetical protein
VGCGVKYGPELEGLKRNMGENKGSYIYIKQMTKLPFEFPADGIRV